MARKKNSLFRTKSKYLPHSFPNFFIKTEPLKYVLIYQGTSTNENENKNLFNQERDFILTP